jgi:nucleotide-binding universal stress UspA family protein
MESTTPSLDMGLRLLSERQRPTRPVTVIVRAGAIDVGVLEAARRAVLTLQRPTLSVVCVHERGIGRLLQGGPIFGRLKATPTASNSPAEGCDTRAVFRRWRARLSPAVAIRWHEYHTEETTEILRVCEDSALIVIEAPRVNASDHLGAIARATLFRTGRPILLVPPRFRGAWGRRVVIGWKNTHFTWRAILESQEWLREVEAVSLIRIGGRGSAELMYAERLLGAFGVRVEFVHVPDAVTSIGAALLAEAQRIDADCLVVGAHQRKDARPPVLGSVTRHLLANVPLPVFMLH